MDDRERILREVFGEDEINKHRLETNYPNSKQRPGIYLAMDRYANKIYSRKEVVEMWSILSQIAVKHSLSGMDTVAFEEESMKLFSIKRKRSIV